MNNEAQIPVKDVIATVTDVANDAADTFATPTNDKQTRLGRWLSFAGFLIKAAIGLFGKKS